MNSKDSREMEVLRGTSKQATTETKAREVFCLRELGKGEGDKGNIRKQACVHCDVMSFHVPHPENTLIR